MCDVHLGYLMILDLVNEFRSDVVDLGSEKKSLKLSASSWFVKPGGSGGSLPFPSRLSHTLNTCLVFLLCSWKNIKVVFLLS